MSDYTKTTDFSAKDALVTGDPEKLATGADVDAEFDAIASMSATKEDKTSKGAANGYCGLDSGGLVSSTDLPATVSYTDIAETRTAGTGTTRVTLTDDTSVDIDADLGAYFYWNIAGNRTLNAPTNLKDGQAIVLEIKQDATGSRTVTWNAIYDWPGGTPPTLSTGGNAVDIFTGIYSDTDTKIRMSTFGLNFS